MTAWRKRLSVATWLVLGAILAVFLGGRWALQQEPEFYRAALAVDPGAHERAGDQLEREVLELSNHFRETGRWEAEFSEEQLNGWLASDLPTKFPRLLPPNISHPRLAIQSHEVQLAFRYADERVNTVVTLVGELFLTEEPNTIGLRIHRASAGLVPLPLKKFVDQISSTAAAADVALRWGTLNNDPVALLTIPHASPSYKQKYVLVDTLEMRDKSVYLSGQSVQRSLAQRSPGVAGAEAPERPSQNDRAARDVSPGPSSR